jgi:hypothetical protein
MDQNFQTSFIPKKALAEDRVERPKSVSVLLFFATIIFIASIAGAAFVFFYKTSLTNQVTQMKLDLKKSEGAFDGDFIQVLQSMDKRINAANIVLGNHVAVSPIFAELQRSTLKSIQYTKFGYVLNGEGPSAQVNVQMSGRSQDYNAIALESAELAKNKYIKEPVFANLTPSDQGDILFDLTFSVDPKFVLYGETLARDGGANAAQPTSGSPTTQQPVEQSPQQSTPQTGGTVTFPGSGTNQ